MPLVNIYFILKAYSVFSPSIFNGFRISPYVSNSYPHPPRMLVYRNVFDVFGSTWQMRVKHIY